MSDRTGNTVLDRFSVLFRHSISFFVSPAHRNSSFYIAILDVLFQRNFSVGAVNSADEKHLSADANVVGLVKHLIANFCKN